MWHLISLKPMFKEIEELLCLSLQGSTAVMKLSVPLVRKEENIGLREL